MSVNYQHSSSYTTYLSATVSTITICFIVLNLIHLTIGYNNGSLQDEKTTFIQVDRFDSEAYYLKENGIEISIYMDQEETVDPSLTQFSVYQVDQCEQSSMNCSAEDRKSLIGKAEPCDEDRTNEINKF